MAWSRAAMIRLVALVVFAIAGVPAGSASAAASPTTIQAVYVVPSDVTPIADRNQATGATVLAVQGWFAEQTSGEYPVFVRTETGITVPTVTLSQTKAQLHALTTNQADATMQSQIHAQVARSANSELLLFLEGTINSGACGYQSLMIVVPIENCGIAPSTSAVFPYGATYLVAHELTHMLGAAFSCAPNNDGTGHVTDDNRDIIYNGPGGRDWANLMLDPGNDDYFQHDLPGCTDIVDSPLMGTWSAPEPPEDFNDGCAELTPTHEGTAGPDDIFGTAGNDIIVTYGGDDRIWGLGGDDIICAGDGNDRIFGGAGNNVLYGGAGIDKIRAGADVDVIYGGDNYDFLKGGHGNDEVYGNDGADRIRGSVGDDELWGGLGNDIMWGGEGDDTVWGGDGDDILKGSNGADYCDGGSGYDIASTTCNEMTTVERTT
ncbi:MAG: hypothetical protein HKN26_05595 [Acidimicrobiales bacterium]|nr:hypothetical protein [Acidimicrobiales bacterium]